MYQIWLIAAVLSGSFLAGCLLTFLSSVRPALRDRFALSETQDQRVSLSFYVSLMVMMVFSGWLVDTWGSGPTVMLGALLGSFGLACLGLNKQQSTVMFAVVALGAGTALLHVSCATAMPYLFFPDEPNRAAGATNIGYAAFGLGILLMPLIAGGLLKKFEFRNSQLLMSLAVLLPAGLMFGGHLDASEPHTLPTQRQLVVLLQDYRIYAAALSIFLFHLLERSVLVWAPPYLEDIGYKRQWVRGVVLGGFWVTFLAGRLLCGTIESLAYADLTLAICIVATAAFAGNMIGTNNWANGAVCFWLLGLCLGPMLPTLVGTIFYKYSPEKSPVPSGLAFGLIVGLGIIGRYVADPLVHRMLRKDKIRSSMWVTMITAIAIIAPMLAWLLSE
ncbi:MAG: sugar MFS transporter [Gemmataceae bacterium]